jgi:orotate phosphoribosyltransferase
MLTRSSVAVPERTFDARKYDVARTLGGEAVLLIDDTWTTGSGAQSAAAALRGAGAGPVAAVVLGRHVKRGWRENDRRLHALAQPFDWGSCAWHGS